MKIGNESAYRPRLSIGFKRMLLEMNQSLDSIKSDVQFNRDYGFYFDHSIYASSDSLTRLEIMVLFLEDRRFFLHRGFELRSVLRLLRRFVRRGKLGGMSTIDQQIVRISTRRNERTVGRKLREIVLAWLCNFHLSKKEMLDYYLHNAYLGYRIEGCEVAAQKIFKRSAEELSWDQAAFVASLFALPFPKAVWAAYSAQAAYPFSEPEELLSFAEHISDRWAKRVRGRMRHAAGNQGFRPKSL